MAGLLDVFNSPDGQLGLGLLAAAAPSMTPMNFAGRLGMANQNFQASQDSALKRQDVAQQIRLRDLQAQQQQRMFDLQTPFLQWASSGLTQPTQPADTSSGLMGPPAASGGLLGPSPVTQSNPQPSSLGPAPAAGGSMFPGVPDAVAKTIIGTGGFAKLPDAVLEYNKPTDFTRLLQAAGIDPNSAIGKQLAQQQIQKQNYLAPVNARPGSILRDPITNQPLAYNPHIPDGATPQFDASGNVVSMAPIPGATDMITAAERAKATGTAQVTPTVAYNGTTPIFSTKALDVQRATPDAPPMTQAQADAQSTPYQRAGSDVAAIQNQIAQVTRSMAPAATKKTQLDILNQELSKAQAAAQAATPAAGTLTPELPAGVKKGAELSQDELSNKGKALMVDNGQAQTVISRLQNIKMLAPGAITGAETGRRDFMNGLLSLAGIKGATDAKTASDLVEKNSAQIVSALRMGQGGGGTDALQTLLGAANPNRHMTVDAINEAVDQLTASQKMVQAKANLLQPHYLKRDPAAYGVKENTFDQNADPRVWQLQSMPADKQAAYVKTLPPEVAKDLLAKRQALKQIGALQ